MSSKSQTQSRGIGLMGLLFVLFLSLKLLNITVVATWSWWWVTAPLWAPSALFLGVAGMIVVGAVVISVVKS
jgi:hypothetical protein